MRKVGFVVVVLAALVLMIVGFRPVGLYLHGTQGMFVADHCEERGAGAWECYGRFLGSDGTSVPRLRLDGHRPAPMQPGESYLTEVSGPGADTAYRLTLADWLPFLTGAALVIAALVYIVRRTLPDYDDIAEDPAG